MSIHPIDYRYGTPEMKALWTEEYRLRCLFRIEAALSQAQEELGLIPQGAAKAISEAAEKADPERAKQIEDEIGHDMMAVVLAMAEVCEFGEWIHLGATSNDILDTATGLQFRASMDVLEAKLRTLLEVLLDLAMANRRLVCAGRTHGQMAVPTTYGLKFAIWASEIARHLDRLSEIRPRAAVGKVSGAVGTQAAFGKDGMRIQSRVMQLIGLNEVDVSNQVVQRDRHAELVCWMGLVVSTLDKICVEIRTLQRTEIAEVEEAFGKKQVGSSTMPHKRNPIKAEQVCGLARSVRAQMEPAFANIPLWDERDLTNSSCERVVFPEAFVLTDHLIRLTTRVLQGLSIRHDNVERNLTMLKGLNMAEAVMVELAKRGAGRQQAHEIMRSASMKAFAEKRELLDVLLVEEGVKDYLSEKELRDLLDPHHYIGTAVEQVERLDRKLRPRLM
ncbi:MAG: adenylosuccinate lyase [Methanosaeta sp. PtaB.Bin039]|nr:MAG: adenylosuccinate lyase [Methanosaeta sp. PtaB.Bin039]HOT06537.1 adenylosuccinate lyase [Methanotrichaceae archaeon]HQF15590.1 adenylosuccinate lyase [Methanotrichaceae archaeon]HQI90326.1 adenylosuccinate lyase [Methanotrichaceae archaeon]HQJ28569.1 adenylosuccinate lyase [Methanotrichaceae archaeon]